VGGGRLSRSAPLGTMFYDPIGQRLLEADITARLLGLKPFMTKDFVELSLKLFVKGRVPDQIIPVGEIFGHTSVGYRCQYVTS
jgi:hypothetical protein